MIKRNKTEFKPNYAVPPGETLLETLNAIGMSQAELANRTGRPKKTVNEIITGKTAITAETALQFERVLGVPASFWNNLEGNYRETLVRLKEDRQISLIKEWAGKFPVAAMIKEGWLLKEESPIERVKSLLNYFGVADINMWEKVWRSPSAIYRESCAFQNNPYAVAAWLRQGEIKAGAVKCDPFDGDIFRESLEKIRLLTKKPPNVFEPEMKKLCAKSGVAVVFVPELPGTHVYGATRWLNGNKVLIQLSLRGKSNDFLWFTFFHEAGHILLHGKRESFIECKEAKEGIKKEKEANKFSSDFLIPPKSYKNFTKDKIFSDIAIKQFANSLNIAPGIVVGRLQHDKFLIYSSGNGLKKRLIFSC